MRSSVFTDADLSKSILIGANFSKSNLGGADLSEADLHKVNLTGADLRNAFLYLADLRNVNLSGVNLCYIKHKGKTLMVHRNKKPNDIHEGKESDHIFLPWLIAGKSFSAKFEYDGNVMQGYDVTFHEHLK